VAVVSRRSFSSGGSSGDDLCGVPLRFPGFGPVRRLSMISPFDGLSTNPSSRLAPNDRHAVGTYNSDVFGHERQQRADSGVGG
jgi:hypothetical protein